MRELVFASVGSKPSIRFQQLINPIYDVINTRPFGECHGHIVKRTFHIKGCSERGPAHPHYAVPFKIREHGPGRHLIDMLRGEGDSHDIQGLASAVDNHGKLITRRKPVGFGKRLADNHLIIPKRFNLSALPQE